VRRFSDKVAYDRCLALDAAGQLITSVLVPASQTHALSDEHHRCRRTGT
jgi:hypothetical protein